MFCDVSKFQELKLKIEYEYTALLYSIYILIDNLFKWFEYENKSWIKVFIFFPHLLIALYTIHWGRNSYSTFKFIGNYSKIII